MNPLIISPQSRVPSGGGWSRTGTRERHKLKYAHHPLNSRVDSSLALTEARAQTTNRTLHRVIVFA